jgi:hypothetical protein
MALAEKGMTMEMSVSEIEAAAAASYAAAREAREQREAAHAALIRRCDNPAWIGPEQVPAYLDTLGGDTIAEETRAALLSAAAAGELTADPYVGGESYQGDSPEGWWRVSLTSRRFHGAGADITVYEVTTRTHTLSPDEPPRDGAEQYLTTVLADALARYALRATHRLLGTTRDDAAQVLWERRDAAVRDAERAAARS